MGYRIQPHEEFDLSLEQLAELTKSINTAQAAAARLEDGHSKEEIEAALDRVLSNVALVFRSIQEARNKLSHQF